MRIRGAIVLCVLFMAFASTSARAADTLADQRLATVTSLMNLFEDNITVENLGKLYTEDVTFIDPMTSGVGFDVVGLQQLTDYFANMKQFLADYSFVISETLVTGDTIAVLYRHKNRFYFTPTYESDFIEYDCTTVYKFHPGETKVYFHQDYYDTVVVYRVVPGLKWLMKIIDRKTAKMFE